MRHLQRAVLAAAIGVTALATVSVTRADASISAYDAVRHALIVVWEELPLTVRNATLVTGTPTAFSQYERRTERTFRPDEPVLVYAELYGYGVAQPADGGFLRELSADLALLDPSGAVRANQIGFWSASERFETRPLEMHLSFSATLGAFPPGDYTLRFTVHDRSSDKETSFDVPITLTEAADTTG